MSRTMKDSGIPWIGEIPEGWIPKKLKFSCKLFGRIGFRGYTADDLVDESEGAITLSPTNMDGIRLDFTKCSYLSWDKYFESPEIMVEKGDVLLVKTASVGKCVYVDYLPKETTVNPQILVLKEHKDCSKFIAYIFQTTLGDAYIDTTKGGSTIYTISQEKIGNYEFAFPPLAEQYLIAAFLDKKCSEIDSLIELQEQMIEELKAYKQSVITEAVTKGIRNEELGVRNYKDSGIEWIGDVPEEWEVCRIKNVASLFGRIGFRGYTSDDLNKDGEGAITLSPSNMLPMGMDYTNVTYLSWMKYNESPEIMIQDGDILMVKTGSSYGKVSYVDNLPKEATINPQILRIVAKINSKYLGYYLQTPLFIYQVEGGVVGGTIPTISQEKINNFFVVIPPLAEQQAIADYLDKKCGEIDELITIKQQKIESLKEYKKSVIYEYVTGKKEP